MDTNDPERFLMLRYGSNREQKLDSTFDSSVYTESEEADTSFDSGKTVSSDDISRSLGDKMRQWRKTSFVALKFPQRKSESTDGSDTTRSEPKRGSFVKLEKILHISKKHHDRLNEVIFHRMARQQESLKNDHNFIGADLTDSSVWTVSDNPLFKHRPDDRISEEEKSES